MTHLHLSQDLRDDIKGSYRNKTELHKKAFITLLVKPHYHLGIFCLQEWSLIVLLGNSLNPLFKFGTCLHLLSKLCSRL